MPFSVLAPVHLHPLKLAIVNRADLPSLGAPRPLFLDSPFARPAHSDAIPPQLSVTGKLRWVKPIQVDDYLFVKSCLTKPESEVKVAIPSPTMVHFRGGRAAIDIESYPDLEVFFEDLAEVYRQEIKALYEAGCRYIQFDDTVSRRAVSRPTL